MKESIGSLWLLGVMIVFITIFACYITITVSYTSSFKMKNELLHIIERHKGITDGTGESMESKFGQGTLTGNLGAFQTMNVYLRGSAYTAKGYCPTDDGTWYGVKELAFKESAQYGNNYEEADNGTKYYYCFAKFGTGEKMSQYSTVYYKVRLFYKFEFPVLADILSIRVDGMTDEIYSPKEQNEVDPLVQNGDIFINNDSI